MSKIKHTPEPWGLREKAEGDAQPAEIKADKKIVATLYPYEFYHVTADEVNANAARIVACVNAMAGIEEPQAFRDILEKLVSYANKASEMFPEKDAKIKQLYTAAENLWQTLNALQMVVGVHLDQDQRKHIKETLANNNPSNYSA